MGQNIDITRSLPQVIKGLFLLRYMVKQLCRKWLRLFKGIGR